MARTSRRREWRSGRRKKAEAWIRMGGDTVGMRKVGGIDANVLVLFNRVILLGHRPPGARCPDRTDALIVSLSFFL